MLRKHFYTLFKQNLEIFTTHFSDLTKLPWLKLEGAKLLSLVICIGQEILRLMTRAKGWGGLWRYVRNMSTHVIISAFFMTLTPGTLRMFLWDHSLVVVHWVFIQIIPEEQSSLYYSCRLQNKAILLTFLNIISSVGAQFKRTETPDWRLSLVYPLYSRCYEMQTFTLVSSCSIGSVNLYLLS